MKQPSLRKRIFHEFYPSPIPGDPEDLREFGNTFFVTELENALNRYYGSSFIDRKSRRPGVDYNDRGWRQRLCQNPFKYHRQLFEIFDRYRLVPRDIDEICDWWGTKKEVDNWVKSHRDVRIVGDEDIWENIPKIRMISTPVAFCHNLASQAMQAYLPSGSQQRRSRIRRLLSRPRGVTSFRDLHRQSSNDGLRPSSGSPAESSGLESSQSSHETNYRTAEGPQADEESGDNVLEDSVGEALNRQLQAGIRNSEFEDWLKEESEMGRLRPAYANIHQPMTPARRGGGHSGVYANNYRDSSNNAVTALGNTITYAPRLHYPPTNAQSYSHRVNDSASMFQGDLHTLPVAVGGPSESALRSQPTARQASSLGRYRSGPYQHYRPIRPRPARNSS